MVEEALSTNTEAHQGVLMRARSNP